MKIAALDRQPRLSTQIAEALSKEIRDGRLKPGDKLPTEQFLAESFSVSRNVVREAIAQLRSGGAVYSRQGIGTIVAHREMHSVNVDLSQLNDLHAFNQVYELRAIVETRAAGLAAVRASAAQRKAINKTFARMQEDRWDEEGVDADLEFHLAIATASQNQYLAKMVKALTDRMRETIVATRQRSGGVVGEIKALTISEHMAIRDAIAKKSPERAREAMARHIGNAAARMGYDLQLEHC